MACPAERPDVANPVNTALSAEELESQTGRSSDEQRSKRFPTRRPVPAPSLVGAVTRMGAVVLTAWAAPVICALTESGAGDPQTCLPGIGGPALDHERRSVPGADRDEP